MAETIIPKGYRLTVTSWENDGDNYNTKIVEGLTKTEIDFFVDGCKQFRSKSRGLDGIGNMYEPNAKDLDLFNNKMCELIKRHPEMKNSKIFGEYFDIPSPEDMQYYESFGHYLADSMFDLFSELSLTGGEFYTRVMERFKVEYIEQDVVMNDVTEYFV